MSWLARWLRERRIGYRHKAVTRARRDYPFLYAGFSDLDIEVLIFGDELRPLE